MKSIPFTESDLRAKGFVEGSPGVFTIPANTLKAADTVAIRGSTKKQKSKPVGLMAIENVLTTSGIKFEREYVFSKVRKFRFDVAIPDKKIGIEYEGIFSKKSRHTGVNGYTTDATKYNLAQLEGWRVLRYTAKNYKHFIDDLKQFI